jgi:hypothetical protein
LRLRLRIRIMYPRRSVREIEGGRERDERLRIGERRSGVLGARAGLWES